MRSVLTFSLLATVLLAGCSKSPEAEAIERNADALADNMEAQADAIDAMADREMAKSGTAKPASPQGLWSYEEKKDEMRGATRKQASLSASNSLNLGFPYGETTPDLVVRKDPKFGFDIFIASNGQPLCRSYNDDTLSVKFDGGPVKEWSCAESADGSPGVVFFNRESALLATIKKSKKMVVEINYYDAGRQQITFPVAGLKW